MKRFFATACAWLLLAFALSPAAQALTPAYAVTGAYRDCAYHKRLSALYATGDPAFDAVAAAMSQLGYHEGDSRADFDGANTAGKGNFTEFCRAYGTVNGTYGYAWCAAFASWCLAQANATEAAGGAFVSCTLWVERLQALGRYHARGTGYTPTAGDLVFYRSAGVARAADHVGLVRYTENGRVYTVEGNAADSVVLRDYALTDTYIAGYGHPRYAGASLGVTAHEADGARGFYTVTNATLNVRAGRGTVYAKCGTLSRGALVEVSEVKNGWGAIRYGGKTAYISLAYAAFTSPVRYTVTYTDESGKNAPRSASYWSFETETASAEAPVREGYSFAGWQTAGGARFAAGDTLPAGDLALTAVWEALPEPEAAPEPPAFKAETAETAPAEAQTDPAPRGERAETAAAWVTAALSLVVGGAWLLRRKTYNNP